MGLDLQEQEGQTPLDEDEKEGLLISTIATRGELDEFEQQNIEQAIQWTFSRKFSPQQVFTEQLIRGLHKQMYREVWAWAGSFRKSNKNIGVDKWQIPTELKALLDDALYWVAHHTYDPDELALRFKHRLVSIHCFANGNGRHSRLMADIIIEKIFGLSVFTWGYGSRSGHTDTRKNYLLAVRAADMGDYAPLLAFARS